MSKRTSSIEPGTRVAVTRYAVSADGAPSHFEISRGAAGPWRLSGNRFLEIAERTPLATVLQRAATAARSRSATTRQPLAPPVAYTRDGMRSVDVLVEVRLSESSSAPLEADKPGPATVMASLEDIRRMSSAAGPSPPEVHPRFHDDLRLACDAIKAGRVATP